MSCLCLGEMAVILGPAVGSPSETRMKQTVGRWLVLVTVDCRWCCCSSTGVDYTSTVFCTTFAAAELYYDTTVYSTSIVYAGAATATPTTVHRDQHQPPTDGLLHPRFARAACILLPFHQGKGNSLSSGRRIKETLEDILQKRLKKSGYFKTKNLYTVHQYSLTFT
jgi:hypothetical protein